MSCMGAAVKGGGVPVRRGLSMCGVVLYRCPVCRAVVAPKIFEDAVSFVEKVFPGGGELLRMRGLEVAA